MIENPYNPDTKTITSDFTNEEWMENVGMVFGSFNVFLARLMDLSFPDFLRMCRDKYGATLVGKEGYSYPIWDDKSKYGELLIELNSRLSKIIRKE